MKGVRARERERKRGREGGRKRERERETRDERDMHVQRAQVIDNAICHMRRRRIHVSYEEEDTCVIENAKIHVYKQTRRYTYTHKRGDTRHVYTQTRRSRYTQMRRYTYTHDDRERTTSRGCFKGRKKHRVRRR
jgi:hypothetical protein